MVRKHGAETGSWTMGSGACSRHAQAALSTRPVRRSRQTVRLQGAHQAEIVTQSSRPAAERRAAWVRALQPAALIVWLAIPVLGLLAQPLAGRLVWTFIVPGLPLLIVLVGYHRWRTICPMAWLNQLPSRLGLASRRRMPIWVERRYYYIPLAAFTIALWLRLIWINGEGTGIALFFVGLSTIAVLFGMMTTGKTWCNYLCPVLFIEKIYTEPCSPRHAGNSQCFPCSACKKACPDINQGNSYWNEIDLPSKRVAYFVYPGLILGFYLYYFLQSGTWDYYFGGASLDEPGVVRYAFAPGYDVATAGFYFFPWIPRAAAALLTLLACAGLSWGIFARGAVPLVDWFLSRQRLTADKRNVILAIAAFTAFVAFYSFAWQAALRGVEWLLPIMEVLTICVASFSLVRRLEARQRSLPSG
jgi:hypothetical protein